MIRGDLSKRFFFIFFLLALFLGFTSSVVGAEEELLNIDLGTAGPDGTLIFAIVESVEDKKMEVSLSELTVTDTNDFTLITPENETVGQLIIVSLHPGAVLSVKGENLSSLEPGTPVMIGGKVSGGQFVARMVADLTLAEAHEPEGDLTPDWKPVGHSYSGVLFTKPSTKTLLNPTFDQQNTLNGSTSQTSLDFPGQFGGPTYEWVRTPNITIFDIGIVRVDVEEVRFTAALAGYSYNFPFSFEVSQSSPLFLGMDNDLNLAVHPQTPAGGASSFYGGLGIDLSIGFQVHTPIGCGDFPWLDPCDWWPNQSIFGIGMINNTQGAAPMPGEQLEVEAVMCPGISVGIPKTPFEAIGVSICSDFMFTGDYFYLDTFASGGYLHSFPYGLAFDGSSPVPVTIMPLSETMSLTLEDFIYRPTLDYGLYVSLSALGFLEYDFPTIWIVQDPDFPLIPPQSFPPCAFFTFQTCGDQPTSLSFPLTAIDGIYYCAESLAAYAEYRDVAQAIANLQGQNDGQAANGAIDLLEKNDLNAALVMVGKAIDNLIDAEEANPGLDLTECKKALSASAKAHAMEAITEAGTTSSTPRDQAKIIEAWELISEGDNAWLAGLYDEATRLYTEAARKVQGIS